MRTERIIGVTIEDVVTYESDNNHDWSHNEIRRDLQGKDVVYFGNDPFGGYEDTILGIFCENGNWYLMESSHCSCNGHGWRLEPTTLAALTMFVQKGDWDGDVLVAINEYLAKQNTNEGE